MPPRVDLLDQLLGGVEDAAARLRLARQRVVLGVALRGVQLQQGLASRRSHVEHDARLRLARLRRRAQRPLERVRGAVLHSLPVARRGDFLRLQGRVVRLARELDELETGRGRRPLR